ncbi:hypothetical protein GCM10009808_19160 [Microbacterium sediminicola]|uniref:Uncharacterized protein n=1 Tax=Microbacterium sediminicola TaxID=415210 RepID=A0ABP4U9M9_9MICO
MQLDHERTVISGDLEIECGATNLEPAHVPLPEPVKMRNGCRLDYARCASRMLPGCLCPRDAYGAC